MASPYQTSVDLPISTFGGRVTQYDPQTLPIGASPYNQDVAFSGVNPSGNGLVAGVSTRPGLATFFPAPFAGNPTVNYIKSYVDSQEISHLLATDSLGRVYDETPCPIPATAPGIIGSIVAASITQSASLFSQEWMAISSPSHPGFGIDIPRRYDGVNFDRVSSVGPGAPGIATDSTLQTAITAVSQAASIVINPAPTGAQLFVNGYAIYAVPPGSKIAVGDIVDVAGVTDVTYDIVGATVAGMYDPGGGLPIQVSIFLNITTPTAGSGGGTIATYVATFTLAIPAELAPGQEVTVAGVTDAGYNGTLTVRTVIDSTHFTAVVSASGLGPSSGGTITLAGNISAGLHQFSVSFIYRSGYITKPAPFGSWMAAGSLGVQISSIPTGPVGLVVGRIVIFTPVIVSPAVGGPFFYFDGNVTTATDGAFPTMVINDNTTTVATFDFLDSVLALSTSADYLFNLLELGECASIVTYSDRTFWAGERNKVPNFNNLPFDGGFFSNAVPLGWTTDPNNGAGGASAQSLGLPVYWGDAYAIVGDGATAVRGTISQTAYQDYLGVPILSINMAYSLRVRVAKNALLTQGVLNIRIVSATAGINGVFTLAAAAATTAYTEYIATLITAQPLIPSDTYLQVYVDGTPSNGGAFLVDCLEIFPTLHPYNTNQIRVSYAEDPESIDQVTGKIVVSAASGQSIRSMFTLLDNKLYIVTEGGIFVTQDDGSNEPSSWSVNTVSATVGTGSVRGVAVGESWAVIAHKTGAYIFWGGEPVKILQEIQPDWDLINWNADQWIYVVVDTTNKRIHIGAPYDGQSTPTVEFVCDYSQLANADGATSASDIASHPQAYYSVYNPTKVVAPGKARKWTLWFIRANCAALTIMSDNSYHLLRGNGLGNGKVYDQVPTQLSDDGAPINSQYQTAFVPQQEDEQQLQLGSHRKDCIYMTGYAFGSGIMSFSMFGAQDQRGVQLSPLTLINPAHWDWEKNVNFSAERMSLLFGTNDTGSWFELTKLSFTIQRTVMTPIRGVQ